MDLLPTLVEHADVVLWTDQGEWDRRLEKLAPVQQYGLECVDWSLLNCDGIAIYHLGNHYALHGAIWDCCRKHPGIVVLHDPCVQDFLGAAYKIGGQDADEYLRGMNRYFGEEGERAARGYLANEFTPEFMAEHFPGGPLVLERARGVVVHSRAALEDLASWERWPVAYAPLPYRPRAAWSRGDLQHRYWAGPPYRLVVFGHLGRNRRLDVILDALATYPRHDAFQLDVYGTMPDPEWMRREVAALGLTNQARIHGHVDDATLDQALSTAHLAINLRYPTMGEASASQLQIWSHGLPSVVSDVGWYATLPANSVLRVRPEREIEDIHAYLQMALDDPRKVIEVGRNGHDALVEQHAPDAYARALVEFAQQIVERSRDASFVLAERANRVLPWRGEHPAADAIRARIADDIVKFLA
jgi:glycosyltransferase involved in cell wall biosynthesis